MRQHEARAGIVRLLVYHPVQPDRAAGQPRHARLPHRPAMPAAAMRRRRYVEAEEAVIGAIAHDRDAGGRLVAQPAHQEALGIGGAEAGGIVEPRIPALGGGPVDGQREVSGGHGADGEHFVQFHKRLQTAMQ